MFAYFQIINLRILKWLIQSASALQWVSIAIISLIIRLLINSLIEILS